MIKKTDKNAVGPSRGLLKLLNKTVMFILLPFRKPLIVIPILLALYIIPTFIGAKPSEVHLWYWHKIQGIFSKAGEGLNQQADKYLSKISLPDFVKSEEKTTPAKELVVAVPETAPQELRRQSFEKATGETKTIDVMEQEPVASETQPTPVAPKQVEKTSPIPTVEPQASVIMPTNKIQRQQSLDLIYLPETQELTGIAHIVNANELEIKGTRLFLYGIYVNPKTAQGFDAYRYLRDLTAGKVVKCLIDAYTNQGVPTGFCYVGTLNLNQALVDAGLSADVAL